MEYESQLIYGIRKASELWNKKGKTCIIRRAKEGEMRSDELDRESRQHSGWNAHTGLLGQSKKYLFVDICSNTRELVSRSTTWRDWTGSQGDICWELKHFFSHTKLNSTDRLL